nr:MAG TPA: hypothetical protein [Caudoviricetes sp.]
MRSISNQTIPVYLVLYPQTTGIRHLKRGNPSRAALLHSFLPPPNPPDPTISESTVTL